MTTEEIVERYGRYVLALCRQQLRNDPPETHEEICQEAWINIHRGLPGFDARAKISTWLYTVTRNTVYAFLDRRRKREAAERAFAAPESTPPRSDEHLALRLALEKIPEEEQKILLMKYSMELSYEEIARETGLTRDQVRHRLIDARKRMRIHLGTRDGRMP